MSVSSVLNAAIKEVGYKEGANNNNKFAAIAGHANNQPWCATFVRACFIKGGEAAAIPDTAYCPTIESWGRSHNAVVPTNEAKKGDLVLFDFDRKGIAQHVGICSHDFDPTRPTVISTIDGNTSGSSTGSQANGDGVFKKVRSVFLVRIVVRPKWSNK